MENLVGNRIKGIPVTQNKQDFIIGVFSIGQILKFTKYTERLITGFDEDDMPIYNEHIQRFVEMPRVEKIADFLTLDPDATFPTNLVLNIPLNVIEKQVNNEDYIEIYLESKVFDQIKKEDGDVYITIIDGQHRIRGIEVAIERLMSQIQSATQTLRSNSSDSIQEKLDFMIERLEDLKNIKLVVSFFIDKSLEYQAMIFSTINRTQKKVSADLVSSLFGLDTRDTPQKTALQAVLSLNGHRKSPFYKRIKLYGGSYSENTASPLSQATMVRSIVNLICENLREAEKDRYRSRTELFNRSANSNRFLPFRKYYAQNRDDVISDILFYYFNAIRNTFKKKDNIESSLWDNQSKSPDNILQTSVGYETLMRILVDIITADHFNENNINESFFNSFLVKAKDLDFSDQQLFPFSTKGKNLLYIAMNLKIWPPRTSSDIRLKEFEKLKD